MQQRAICKHGMEVLIIPVLFVRAYDWWVYTFTHLCVISIGNDVLDGHYHVFSVVFLVSEQENVVHRGVFRLSRALRLGRFFRLSPS